MFVLQTSQTLLCWKHQTASLNRGIVNRPSLTTVSCFELIVQLVKCCLCVCLSANQGGRNHYHYTSTCRDL